MKLFSVFIILIITLGSCNSENKKNEIKSKNLDSKILGKWIFADEYFISRYDDEGFEVPPPPPRERLGYNFFTKDSCETNFSFFKINDTTKLDFRGHYSDRKNLGRKTVYKIENDSLKIFNRTFNRWDSFYIMRLDSNNLVLNNQNSVIQQFARKLKN